MQKYNRILLGLILILLSGCSSHTDPVTTQDTILKDKHLPTLNLSPAKRISDKNIQKEIVYLDEKDVAYVEVNIADSMEFTEEEGKGILIDLNGDGIQERIYLKDKNIYINDILQISDAEYAEYSKESAAFWLIDIDLEDDYIELLIYHSLQYSLFYYDKSENLRLSNNDVCGYYDTCHSFEETVDIRKPQRIDAHTISFRNFHFLFDSYQLSAHYRIAENHILEVIAQPYELEYPRDLCYINESISLKLYTERDLKSTYAEVSAPQTVTITKSDAVNWVYLVSEEGVEGWVQVERSDDGYQIINENLSIDDFTGYNEVP